MTVLLPSEALVRRQARTEVRERIALRADFPPANIEAVFYQAAFEEVLRVLDDLDVADGFTVAPRVRAHPLLPPSEPAEPDPGLLLNMDKHHDDPLRDRLRAWWRGR